MSIMNFPKSFTLLKIIKDNNQCLFIWGDNQLMVCIVKQLLFCVKKTNKKTNNISHIVNTIFEIL